MREKNNGYRWRHSIYERADAYATLQLRKKTKAYSLTKAAVSTKTMVTPLRTTGQ